MAQNGGKMHQCIKFILCFNDILHVSDGLSVHHQEFKTVNTGICLTAVCKLASRQQYMLDKSLLLYVQSWTPDDGRKDGPKHVECHSKIKQIWYTGASSWFYYRNNITMHGSMNFKLVKCLFNFNTYSYNPYFWYFDTLAKYKTTFRRVRTRLQQNSLVYHMDVLYHWAVQTNIATTLNACWI